MEKPRVATNVVSSAANEPSLVAPHGLDEIIASFGDVYEYIGADGQLDFLKGVSLPFSIRLWWDPSRTITQMTCHRRLTRVSLSAFGCIQERGLQARIMSFGGCFAFGLSATTANCRPTVGASRLI
jgi:hypothetical protein